MNRQQNPASGTSSVVQWLRLHASIPGFHWFGSWSGNQDPTCHIVWPKKKDSQTLQFPANVYGSSYLQFLIFLLCEIITHIFLHRSPFGHIIPHWMLLTLYGWHCSELSDPYYYPHRRFYESRKHFWGIDDIFLIWGYNSRAVETYKAHSTR